MMARETPKKRRRAVELAGAALTAARGGDWGRATGFLQRIADECGQGGIQRAMLAYCDTAIAHSGLTHGQRVRIAFQQLDGEQRVTDADGATRPEVVWAGRMLSARVADDEDMWNALISAMPSDPRGAGAHVGAVLELCLHTLSRPPGAQVR